MTIVKENIFLLDDALGRLADVKKRQEEMADAETWAKQPAHLRAEREKRLDSVKRTAKAFLDLGKACLGALLLLTADSDVCVAFIGAADRKHKVAQMLVQFIRRLCGPECMALKVVALFRHHPLLPLPLGHQLFHPATACYHP